MSSPTYDLAQLVDDRNRALYEETAAQVQIDLQPSNDAYWGERLDGSKLTIEYAKSTHPVGSFAHELLHGKHDLAGRARPALQLDNVTSQAEWDDVGNRCSQLKTYFYNSLIHHRMFPEFTALGFPANEFLADADAEDFRRVPNDLRKLESLKRNGKSIPVTSIALLYFTIRSPESAGPDADALRKRLRKLNDHAYYALEKLLAKWNDDPAPDVRRYLGHLFFLCGEIKAGFSYDDNAVIWARDCAAAP